jgi:hypothetical protein
MKALVSDPRALLAVLWAVLLAAFSIICVALAGLTARLHKLVRAHE